MTYLPFKLQDQLTNIKISYICTCKYLRKFHLKLLLRPYTNEMNIISNSKLMGITFKNEDFFKASSHL